MHDVKSYSLLAHMNLDEFPPGISKLPAQNVLKVPDNVDYIEAAMVEPSAVVAHGFL